MFARQIAVMKGQAWNVVETLKQRDHGPLELTRRTRVCVWDDLVNVPVAIPLRTPSTDAHTHRANGRNQHHEEMDIGAAISAEPRGHRDLLSFGSPTSELPNPNRFELSRDRASMDSSAADGIVSPVSLDNSRLRSIGNFEEGGRKLATSWAPTAARLNDQHSRRRSHINGKSPSHKKRNSISQRRDSAFDFGGDDLEGDLGYAAAEEMDGHERKVIVERLETVKSKNPVFTWW